MPVTITLKNVPDVVYEQLKVAAEVHHRSLNSEVIACLETVLLPVKKAPLERLARARVLRAQLNANDFSADEMSNFKNAERA